METSARTGGGAQVSVRLPGLWLQTPQGGSAPPEQGEA